MGRAVRGVLMLLGAALILAMPIWAAGGELDPTFGGSGKVTTDFAAGSNDTARAAVVQPDGKVVVAGEMLGNNEWRIAVVRYTVDGSLDPSFGINGKVKSRIAPMSAETGNAVALQSDGKILVVGWGSGDFVIARYNPDGSTDTSFGGDGYVLDDFGAGRDEALALAVRADGKIIVVGQMRRISGPQDAKFAVARYNPNGSSDPSFDTDGQLVTDITSGDDSAQAVAIQRDGRLVVGGSGPGAAEIVRYWNDGGLDYSFGTNGIVLRTTPTNSVSGLALQADGKILTSGGPGFRLTRFNEDGSVDTGFGDGGSAFAPFPDGEAHALAVDSEGRIVVAGRAGVNFAVARFTPAGILDSSFGSGGMIETDFGAFESANAIALAPGGKFVVAGVAGPFAEGPFDFAVSRYLGAPPLPPPPPPPPAPPPRCLVPRVIGKSLATARAKIRKAHCAVGRITRKPSTRVKRGRVIAQSRRPGIALRNGAKVNLVVSTGRKPQR